MSTLRGDTVSPITLTTEYTKRLTASAVPGSYFDPESKSWVLLDPSPRAAAVALKLFPDLARAHPELVERRDQLRKDARPFDHATDLGLRIAAPTVESALLADGFTFYDYQSLDLGYVKGVLEAHGAAYVGWERGLGKTLATCALIEALGCRRTLVVAPNTAKNSVWLPELERFLPGHQVYVIPNGKDQRDRFMRSLQQGEFIEPFVLVIHYEALTIIDKRPLGVLLKAGGGWQKFGEWDLVVADEAHRLKNPKAQMTRAIKKIPAHMKLALSGSIIENHAEELFSPLQWLFPDSYSSKWRDWNDRFLDYVDGPFGKLCVGIRQDRLDALRDELGRFMVYRRKEDELDLPTKTEQTLLVDLSPGQRRAYEELRDTCLAELDSGDVVAAEEGLVMLTRLRQVATGLDLLVDDVRDSTKLDLTLELIQDNEDEAFVVFTWYKAAAYALAERLEAAGVEHFVVTGDVTHARRADYIERFQAGEGRVFIGTLSTLGESVNLHRASNAVFLDRSWNPATNAQAADRIYRIGQTKPVTITHLIARDTVDELRVQPALQSKEALRAAILGSP